MVEIDSLPRWWWQHRAILVNPQDILFRIVLKGIDKHAHSPDILDDIGRSDLPQILRVPAIGDGLRINLIRDGGRILVAINGSPRRQ